jgi:hypothetical protein
VLSERIKVILVIQGPTLSLARLFAPARVNFWSHTLFSSLVRFAILLFLLVARTSTFTSSASTTASLNSAEESSATSGGRSPPADTVSILTAGNGVPELADEREVFGQDCDSLCMDGGEVNVLVGGGRRRERGRSKKYRKKERKRKKEKNDTKQRYLLRTRGQ